MTRRTRWTYVQHYARNAEFSEKSLNSLGDPKSRLPAMLTIASKKWLSRYAKESVRRGHVQHVQQCPAECPAGSDSEK